MAYKYDLNFIENPKLNLNGNEYNYEKRLKLLKKCFTLKKYFYGKDFNKILIFDAETTGVGKFDQILDLTFINMKGDILFSSLLNPTCEINEGAANANGHTNEELSEYKNFKDIWKQLKGLLKNYDIYAWDGAFILRILEQTCYAFDIRWDFNIKIMSIKPIYHYIISETKSEKIFNINNAYEYFNLDFKNEYNSLKDAINIKNLIDYMCFVYPGVQVGDDLLW